MIRIDGKRLRKEARTAPEITFGYLNPESRRMFLGKANEYE
jgi:hypothetical protein